MNATERLLDEQLFHDRQARLRALCLPHPEQLRFRDDDYLDHETWIRPAMARLGPVAGRRVLDFGCGHGMASVVLARQGAHVTAFDLSPGYVQEARRRAEANGVRIHCLQADGQRLPFANNSFDAIWGNAILHHLDIPNTARELQRVLAPGGVAVFCEPWGGNPLLEAARRWLPYPGKERTPDETPLRRPRLATLRTFFPDLSCEGFQFLSMARRLIGPGPWADRLSRWDEFLLGQLPWLSRYCRYVVLTLRRPLYNDKES